MTYYIWYISHEFLRKRRLKHLYRDNRTVFNFYSFIHDLGQRIHQQNNQFRFCTFWMIIRNIISNIRLSLFKLKCNTRWPQHHVRCLFIIYFIWDGHSLCIYALHPSRQEVILLLQWLPPGGRYAAHSLFTFAFLRSAFGHVVGPWTILSFTYLSTCFSTQKSITLLILW